MINKSLSFVTIALPCFNIYRDLFFSFEGVKIIPQNIGELLTPIELAFWIMDDGSRHNTGLHLNVYGFSISDVEIILAVLRDKFSLKCLTHVREWSSISYLHLEGIDEVFNKISTPSHASLYTL